MTEYQPQEMDYIRKGSLLHILHRIGPVWAVEYPDMEGGFELRYFDEETAKEEWAELKGL